MKFTNVHIAEEGERKVEFFRSWIIRANLVFNKEEMQFTNTRDYISDSGEVINEISSINEEERRRLIQFIKAAFKGVRHETIVLMSQRYRGYAAVDSQVFSGSYNAARHPSYKSTKTEINQHLGYYTNIAFVLESEVDVGDCKHRFEGLYLGGFYRRHGGETYGIIWLHDFSVIISRDAKKAFRLETSEGSEFRYSKTNWVDTSPKRDNSLIKRVVLNKSYD